MRKSDETIAEILSVVLFAHLDEFLEVAFGKFASCDHCAPPLLVSGCELVLAYHSELFVELLNLRV